MHAERIKQLPMIDPVTGRMTGTLHQRDVLRVFTRPAAELEADIRAVVPRTVSIEVDAGIVKISGTVERRSQAIALVRAVRLVEGVVDVAWDKGDLLTGPPLR